MTLSVVIPTWSGNGNLAQMALSLAKQVRPMCDELVITEVGHYHPDLQRIADVYLFHSERLRHGDNLNRGIKEAHGDFLALMDSDIEIRSGDLRKLCIPGKVVCPEFANLREAKGFQGFFFVTPREILEELPIFERPGPEGIDHWARQFMSLIERTGRYQWSGELSYWHHSARSYGLLMSQVWDNRIETPKIMEREISPDRHRQRLLDDLDYSAQWSDPEAVEPTPPPLPSREGPRLVVPEDIKKMKLSMVVPTFSKDARRLEIARHTCAVWCKQVDELIIVEDGGIFDEELAKIAHTYIYHADNVGPGENMNIGWRLAHAGGADFVAIADSDVQLYRGTVRELCIPGKVATPAVAQHPTSAACVAPMLVVPRQITDAVGMYDIKNGEYRNEGFDHHYQMRLHQYDSLALTRIDEVLIWHTGGATRFDNGWMPFPEK